MSLSPAPPRRDVRLMAAGAGLGAFGAGLFLGGAELTTACAASVAGVLASLLTVRELGPTTRGTSPPMAIVPWGVLVHSEPEPRVLRWAAVSSIDVELVHEMDHATPATRWSSVTIRTARDVLFGRARGNVCLERLEAHLEAYAEEAALPVALDLDGERCIEDPLEPVFERVLTEARRVLATGELGERLSLAPESYRHARSAISGVRTRDALGAALDAPNSADPRILAAVLSAELGARDVLPEILALTAFPSPLLSAVARASALRLGAEAKRVGALSEVEPFLFGWDLDALQSWLSEGTRSRRSAAA